MLAQGTKARRHLIGANRHADVRRPDPILAAGGRATLDESRPQDISISSSRIFHPFSQVLGS